MDGAAMFSYRGLFPPEMSVCEKMYAGWADAFTLPLLSEQEVTLPAASLRQPGSFLKIPISGDEYFLVENRHRDPDRSEEHTSELQSRGHLVCRLLLEKKNN